MFSDKAISLIRKKTLPLSVALSVVLFWPAVVQSAVEHSYALEIEQDVAEDKVYLLESIRQNVTTPAEKTVLDAILSEDGPQAISLYQKQLKEYPDPVLDKLSSSRIAAYKIALDSSEPTQKRSIPHASAKLRPSIVIEETTKNFSRLNSKIQQPSSEKSLQETIVAGPTTFSLQFGSFENRRNAEILAKKISHYAPVTVVQRRDLYKVQLKKHYATKEEAAVAATKMPFKTIVIPSL